MVAHEDDATAAAAEGQGAERIAKALARAGVASRREVERLIAEGRVSVNGERLTSPAVKVSAADRVTVDGRPVRAAERTRLFGYHKPPGLVTTHRDPKGRPTVFEALPRGLPRLISVGRLDLNSEGLLLLTNDGELARRLELPSSGLVRRYRARARGDVDQRKLDRLRDGVTVAGARYGPIQARIEPGREEAANRWISLSLAEGKNREVRKVLEALGLTVNRLIRVGYGPYELGDLARGEMRELHPDPLSSPSGGSPREAGAGGHRRSRLRPPPSPPTGPTVPPRGEQKRKPGWAKPKPRSKVKPSGSRPGPGPRAKPRGPKPSASPRGRSGAHPPGPRPAGGRWRRG